MCMRVRRQGVRGGGGAVVTVMVEAVQNIEPRSNICLQFYPRVCVPAEHMCVLREHISVS